MSPTHRAPRPAGVPRPLRVIVPALLILIWLTAGAIGGPYFGRVDEVTSHDQTTFLPESAEATLVPEQLGDFTGDEAIPAIVVITGNTPVGEEDLAVIEDETTTLTDIDGVLEDISPAISSEDQLAVQIFVPIDADADLTAVVEEIDDALAADLPEGLTVQVTGPAGFSADLGEAFTGIDGLLLAVALIAVLVILIVVYRSFLLPLIVLSTSVFALCAALLTVWRLAAADIVLFSGQTQGILFILVIGASTDYALLYVARYGGELRMHEDRWPATLKALRGTLEPDLASGCTVIAGLMCLLRSDLKSKSTLTPIASLGILLALLSAVIFLPARRAVRLRAGRLLAAQPPRRPVCGRERADAGRSRGLGPCRPGRLPPPPADLGRHRVGVGDRLRRGAAAAGRWRPPVRAGARCLQRPGRPGGAWRALPRRRRQPGPGDRGPGPAAGRRRCAAGRGRHRLGRRQRRGLPQRHRSGHRGRRPAPRAGGCSRPRTDGGRRPGAAAGDPDRGPRLHGRGPDRPEPARRAGRRRPRSAGGRRHGHGGRHQ